MRRSLPVVLVATLLTLPTGPSLGARQAQSACAGSRTRPSRDRHKRRSNSSASASAPTASSRGIRRSSSTSSTSRKRPTASSTRSSARRRWGIRTCWRRSARRRTSRSLDRLVAINKRLADPRGLTEAEAKKLALEGRAFYLVYATIHSTEVGNTQALTEIVHRLATDNGTRHPADARQRRAARRSVTESRRPGPRRRSLVQDEGHAVRARVPGPLPQVRRARRQPRLVHVHAARDAARGGEGPQRVQADHHPRHAPAGHDRARACSCRRSTIRTTPTCTRS